MLICRSCNCCCMAHCPAWQVAACHLSCPNSLLCIVQELVVGTPVDQQPQATNGCSQQASRLPQCAARLSAGLQGMQEHMQQLLQPDAAYLGCVLPGHALSAAALLLSETCSWLVLCLEVRELRQRHNAGTAWQLTEGFALTLTDMPSSHLLRKI